MFRFGSKKQKKKDNLNNSSSTTATSSSSSSRRQSTTTTRTSSTTPPANKKNVPWDLELETGTATWQSSDIPPLPDGKRYHHAAATLPDGSVVVAGGRLNGSVTNTVWIWAPQSALWTAGPPLQELRAHLALVVCGNRLYAIGGYNDSVRLDTVECLDVSVVCGGTQGQEPRTGLSSQSWTTLPCRLSSKRSGCAAVAVSDRHLVVMGGYDGTKYLDTVDLLDTQGNTAKLAPSRMTTARGWFGAAAVDGTIYAVGGENSNSSSSRLNTVECCDIVVDRSSSRSSKGTWLSGGANSNQELDTAAPWRVVPALRLSTGRHGFGLATLGRRLIVAGGYDGKSYLKSVEVVDTQKGKVWQLPEMGSARNCCAAVALHDGRVAVSGGDGLDSVETLLLLDPQTKLKAKFSSRAQLDWNIQKQTKLVERAKRSTDLDVLTKGADAEKQLLLLLPLCDLEEFKSAEELSSDIQKEHARMKQCETIAERIPIVENIKALEKRLENELADKTKFGGKTNSPRPATKLSSPMGSEAKAEDIVLPFQAERTQLRNIMDGREQNLCPLSQEYVDHITTSKKLGEGFFGVVYAGYDSVLQKSFAIKKIRPEILQHAHMADIELARASFQQELATLAKFQHPNIAMLFGFHFQKKIQGMQSLVFELAECGSLDYFWMSDLGRERLSSDSIRLKIALDTFTAVHFLHQGGEGIKSCFHRDIKSSNICLTRDLTAKLIDCGLAKLVDENNMDRLSTSVKGTRGYTCPLYESGELTGYEAACDVFSFGVVMTELWTGMLQNHSSGSGKRAVNFHRKYVLRKDPMEQDLDPSMDVDRDVNGLPTHLLDYARLAVSCMQEEPQNRPTGGEVLRRLRAICRACDGPKNIPEVNFPLPLTMTRQVRCVCQACLIESDCFLSEDGDYLCVVHCWRAVQAGKFVNEKYSKHHDLLAQQKEMGEDLKKEIKSGFSTISQKLEGMSTSLAHLEAKVVHPIPRLFVVFPRCGKQRGFWKSYKSWLGSMVRQKLNLFFVCAHSGEAVSSCPIKLFVTREWVKTVGPALVLSLKLLSLAGIAVSGIPLDLSGVVEEALLSTSELDKMAQELVGKVLDRDDKDLIDRISSGKMDDQDVKRLNHGSLGFVAERAMSENGWMDEMVCVRKRGQSVVLWVKQKYANLPIYERVNI